MNTAARYNGNEKSWENKRKRRKNRSGAISRKPKAAFSTISDVKIFHPTGRDIYLGELFQKSC